LFACHSVEQHDVQPVWDTTKGNVEIQNAVDLHYSGTFGYPAPFAKLWQWNKVVVNEKGKCQDVQLHIGWKLKTNNPKDSKKKDIGTGNYSHEKKNDDNHTIKENPYNSPIY